VRVWTPPPCSNVRIAADGGWHSHCEGRYRRQYFQRFSPLVSAAVIVLASRCSNSNIWNPEHKLLIGFSESFSFFTQRLWAVSHGDSITQRLWPVKHGNSVNQRLWPVSHDDSVIQRLWRVSYGDSVVFYVLKRSVNICDHNPVNTIRDRDIDGSVQSNRRFHGRNWMREWGKCCCRPAGTDQGVVKSSIIIIIITTATIIYPTCSWATCWPIPLSHTSKSL